VIFEGLRKCSAVEGIRRIRARSGKSRQEEAGKDNTKHAIKCAESSAHAENESGANKHSGAAAKAEYIGSGQDAGHVDR
jgi:hypothetical protein